MVSNQHKPKITSETIQNELNLILNKAGYSEFLVKGKVFTLFTHASQGYIDHHPDQALKTTEISQCMARNGLGFGHGGNKLHDTWHVKSTSPKDPKEHYHIGDPKRKLLTPEMMNCLVSAIKTYEKENNLCQDGKEGCLIPDKASKVWQAQYAKFYANQPEVIEDAFKKNITIGFEAFAQGLLVTLFNKYILPYIISKKANDPSNKLTQKEIESIKYRASQAIAFLTTRSPINALYYSVFLAGTQYLLSQWITDKNLIDSMTNTISTTIAFTKNPFSLVELGMTAGGFTMGEDIAHKIITLLPKIKSEPAIETVAVTEQQAGARKKM